MRSKKTIALILSLLMLISLLPAVAVATETTPGSTSAWSIYDAVVREVTVETAGTSIQVKVYEDTYLDTTGSRAYLNDGEGNANRAANTVRVIVPAHATAESPMLLMTNNSGWINNTHLTAAGVGTAEDGETVAVAAGGPNEAGYVSTALLEGYVIVTAAVASLNLENNRLPATLGDWKAVIRYLRYNADNGDLPAGNPDRIVLTGHSGGGGLIAALGTSGNAVEFLPYLYGIGAAGVTYDSARAGGRPAPVIPLGLVDGPDDYHNYYGNLDAFDSTINDDVWIVNPSAMINGVFVADMANSWGWTKARSIGLDIYDEMPLATSAETGTVWNKVPTFGALNEYGATQGTVANGRLFGAEFGDYLAGLNLRWNGAPVAATFDPVTFEIGGNFVQYMEHVLLEGAIRANAGRQGNIPAQSEAAMVASITSQPANDWGLAGEEPDNWRSWLTFTNGVPSALDLDGYLFWTWRQAGGTQRGVPAWCRWNSQHYFFGMQSENLRWGMPTETGFNIFHTADKDEPLGATVRRDDAEMTPNRTDDINSTPMMTQELVEHLNQWANWEEYSTSLTGKVTAVQAKMLDPFGWVSEFEGESDVAPNWYVQYGMIDRDISPIVSALFALTLENYALVDDVVLRMHWQGPHGNSWWDQADFHAFIKSKLPPAPGIRVLLDGSPLSFDVAPQVINGRTLVPLRAIFEALGAEVEWVGATQTATATKDDTVVVLIIGNTSPTVNGEVVTIEVAGTVVNGRTLVPLRFVAEAFGVTVDWNSATRTVTIES